MSYVLCAEIELSWSLS